MKKHIATKAIHDGESPDFRDGSFGDVVSPLHLSTTFARLKVDEPTAGYEYIRSGNPTRKALEKKLASVENGKNGYAFASGLAAETTLLLSLLKQGDHIIAGDDLYGGTVRLLNNLLPKFGITVTYVDTTNTDNIASGIQNNSKLLWVETLSNPLLKLTDIKLVSDLAHEHDLLVVADNTFLTPVFFKPLEYGVDVVVHSTTKYFGGHSDVLGGALIIRNDEIAEKISFYQNSTGAVASPFDSYLTMRGMKTLSVRMLAHERNAFLIADFLAREPKVEKVIYPGLQNYGYYQQAETLLNGYGGMISFYIRGGKADAIKFLESLRLIHLAESLGGVESLIEHPATMTHASVPEEIRSKTGVTDSLIRLSVGIEDADDLVKDLEQAFDRI
jgi:cystathionine gamma-lyase